MPLYLSAPDDDEQTRRTLLRTLDRLSAPVLRYLRHAARSSSDYAPGYRSGYETSSSSGLSFLELALSALALLAFGVFFAATILPIITGGGARGARSADDDPLPLDLTQELVNLLNQAHEDWTVDS